MGHLFGCSFSPSGWPISCFWPMVNVVGRVVLVIQLILLILLIILLEQTTCLI